MAAKIGIKFLYDTKGFQMIFMMVTFNAMSTLQSFAILRRDFRDFSRVEFQFDVNFEIVWNILLANLQFLKMCARV